MSSLPHPSPSTTPIDASPPRPQVLPQSRPSTTPTFNNKLAPVYHAHICHHTQPTPVHHAHRCRYLSSRSSRPHKLSHPYPRPSTTPTDVTTTITVLILTTTPLHILILIYDARNYRLAPPSPPLNHPLSSTTATAVYHTHVHYAHGGHHTHAHTSLQPGTTPTLVRPHHWCYHIRHRSALPRCYHTRFRSP